MGRDRLHQQRDVRAVSGCYEALRKGRLTARVRWAFQPPGASSIVDH